MLVLLLVLLLVVVVLVLVVVLLPLLLPLPLPPLCAAAVAPLLAQTESLCCCTAIRSLLNFVVEAVPPCGPIGATTRTMTATSSTTTDSAAHDPSRVSFRRCQEIKFRLSEPASRSTSAQTRKLAKAGPRMSDWPGASG